MADPVDLSGEPLTEAACSGCALRWKPCRRGRAVFLMSARDGLDHRDIADQLGITVRDVERLLADAMLAIDTALTDPRRLH